MQPNIDFIAAILKAHLNNKALKNIRFSSKVRKA
jgi:hypothetical protein